MFYYLTLTFPFPFFGYVNQLMFINIPFPNLFVTLRFWCIHVGTNYKTMLNFHIVTLFIQIGTGIAPLLFVYANHHVKPSPNIV